MINGKHKKTSKWSKGCRIINFCSSPDLCKSFSRWGADVIKIEAPSGDPARAAGAIFKMPITEEENPLLKM